MRTIVNLHTLVTVLVFLGALGQLAVTLNRRDFISREGAGQPLELLPLLLPLGLSLLLGAVALLNWSRPRLCGLLIGGSALVVLLLALAGTMLPVGDNLQVSWPHVAFVSATFYVLPAGVTSGLLLMLSWIRLHGTKPDAPGPSRPQHPAGPVPAA